MGIELKPEILSRINQLAKSAAEGSLQPQAARVTNPATEPGLNLARSIDHTLLKPETTRADIQRICKEAREHGFATVCINSAHIAEAATLLHESSGQSSTLPIAVIGFPLGACTTSTKVFETREAIRLGAREIDMVIPVGALKEEDYAYVLNDIHEVVEAARPYPVKVILETSLLDMHQKVAACVLSVEAGAAFVKTSTGFSGGGATVEDIRLMRAVVGPNVGVKASGGVRTREDALKMIAAGANRIGTSSGPAIVSANKASPQSANSY
jgi:deoxyribose-phosphate aldolase